MRSLAVMHMAIAVGSCWKQFFAIDQSLALYKAFHKVDYAKPAIVESGRSECRSNAEGPR